MLRSLDMRIYSEGGQLVYSLQSALRDGKHGLRSVPALIVKIVDGDMWQERQNEHGITVTYKTFEAFVAGPLPEGLGGDMATLRSLCHDDPVALDALDRVVQREGGRPVTVDNVNGYNTGDRPTGNSAATALRVLRRDEPALHAKVLAGELSPHGAMVAAGKRPKTATVRLDDPRRAAAALARAWGERLPELLAALAGFLPLDGADNE